METGDGGVIWAVKTTPLVMCALKHLYRQIGGPLGRTRDQREGRLTFDL